MQSQHPTMIALEEYNEINRGVRRIALEADFLANFTETAKNVVPRLTSFVKTQILNLSNFVKTSPEVSIGQLEVITNAVSKLSLTEAGKLSIYVPEGFKSDLLSYTEYLSESMKHVSGLVPNVLNPYNIFLAKIVTSKSFRMSSFSEVDEMVSIIKEMDALAMATSVYFDINSTLVKKPINDVFNRNSDIRPTLLNAQRLQHEVSKIDFKPVKNLIDSISELLETISKMAKNSELSDISGEIIKSLGELSLGVAREIEFYSITIYRVQSLYNQLVNTAKEMK